MVKEFVTHNEIHARRLEEMGALTIDYKKYGRVLARVLPRVIVTDEEHERLLGEVESLMDKGEHRTAEEDAALELMVRFIQDYDERHHPLPDPDPREMLVYLMEQRGLKQAGLIPIFGSGSVSLLNSLVVAAGLPCGNFLPSLA
jgi:HTH-type transcriptional regulator/antitoxin HigA